LVVSVKDCHAPLSVFFTIPMYSVAPTPLWWGIMDKNLWALARSKRLKPNTTYAITVKHKSFPWEPAIGSKIRICVCRPMARQ